MRAKPTGPVPGHAAPPRRPIRYGPFARLGDWWNATRDGKAALSDVAADPPLTPTFELHSRTYEDRSRHEWKEVLVATAQAAARSAVLEAEIGETEQAVLLVEKRLDAMPDLSDAELTQRRSGETDTDPGVVRARRSREHGRVRGQLQRDLDDLRGRLPGLRVEREQVRRTIRIRETVGAVRIARLHAHTQRRLAAYERRLVRVHPEGARLVPLLAPHHPTLPEWAKSLADGPTVDAL